MRRCERERGSSEASSSEASSVRGQQRTASIAESRAAPSPATLVGHSMVHKEGAVSILTVPGCAYVGLFSYRTAGASRIIRG